MFVDSIKKIRITFLMTFTVQREILSDNIEIYVLNKNLKKHLTNSEYYFCFINSEM